MTERRLFIGDEHGYHRRYENILKKSTCPSVQVGDMGMGFYRMGHDGREACTNASHSAMVKHGGRFIRGNHDNPNVCRNHSQWIKDGSIEMIGDSKVMFIGGAWSIDADRRVPGMSWWEDEQCSMAELSRFTEIYRDEKPDVMVTHDCPNLISQHYFLNAHKPYIPTRTDQVLQAMFEEFAPKLWIFGHWHISLSANNALTNGCQFICLGELETIELEL